MPEFASSWRPCLVVLLQDKPPLAGASAAALGPFPLEGQLSSCEEAECHTLAMCEWRVENVRCLLQLYTVHVSPTEDEQKNELHYE